jgi:hypothetical protein
MISLFLASRHGAHVFMLSRMPCYQASTCLAALPASSIPPDDEAAAMRKSERLEADGFRWLSS